jgi:hypothetical protein
LRGLGWEWDGLMAVGWVVMTNYGEREEENKNECMCGEV